MNVSRASETYWIAALWIAVALSIAFYLAGALVNVPWGNTPVPLGEVLRSMNWRTAVNSFAEDGGFLVFILAVVCAAVYTQTASWRLRLAAMVAGFSAPLILIGAEIIITVFYAPFLIVGAMSGDMDGEFYVEGMPQAGAVGLWLLVCVIFAVREVSRGIANAQRSTPLRSFDGAFES